MNNKVRRRGAERLETRIIHVGQGIFALRYLSSTADEAAPVVTLEAGHSDGFTLIAAPGCPDGVLERPGTCLVIRAERPSSLHVTVSTRHPDGVLDAALRLERIVATSASRVDVAPLDRPDIEIMAHVARRGDVAVPMNEWVGGPGMPSRIEGVTIDWPDRPDDVELRYTAVGRGRNRRRWTDCQAGDFAGSRGEAAPLVGLEISLVGRGAGRWALSGDALFLGSHVISETGPVLRFAGPTGAEPLVGLRLAIEPAHRAATPVRVPAGPSGPNLTGRVRVFRGGAVPAA